jgi:nicotinamidase-related amidase
MPLSPYDAPQVIERSVSLGRAIRQAGGLVVLVNVAFASGFADRLSQPVDAPSPPGGLPADWSDFAPEIASLPGDVIVTKRQWGAFHGTELDLQLRRRGITTIVLGGIATNFGVESTAREAWQHGYAVIIAEDACTSIGPEMHSVRDREDIPAPGARSLHGGDSCGSASGVRPGNAAGLGSADGLTLRRSTHPPAPPFRGGERHSAIGSASMMTWAKA